MNKTKLLGSICFLMVFAVGFMLGIHWQRPIFQPIIYREVDKPDHLYEEIINKIYTNRTYIPGHYVCSHFSRDLTCALQEEGYEAYFMSGKRIEVCNETLEGCSHAWVKLCVNIEATEGRIQPPDYYNRTYAPREAKAITCK